jgi:hypothetical protein
VRYVTDPGTKDETIHTVVLALNEFRVENYGNPPTNYEACETVPWGSASRRCLRAWLRRKKTRRGAEDG